MYRNKNITIVINGNTYALKSLSFKEKDIASILGMSSSSLYNQFNINKQLLYKDNGIFLSRNYSNYSRYYNSAGINRLLSSRKTSEGYHFSKLLRYLSTACKAGVSRVLSFKYDIVNGFEVIG